MKKKYICGVVLHFFIHIIYDHHQVYLRKSRGWGGDVGVFTTFSDF